MCLLRHFMPARGLEMFKNVFPIAPITVALMAAFFISGCGYTKPYTDAAKTVIQPILDKLPDVEPTQVDEPPFDDPS